MSDASARVAIIGAGLAGLACAGPLHRAGLQVTVYEKSRGLGGRSATRRIGEVGVDHGAQYFTARSPAFQEAVQGWADSGVAAPWRGRIGVSRGGGLAPAGEDLERWVGVPGMSTLAAHLAEGIPVRRGVRVAPPERQGGGWRLRTEAGEPLGEAELVLVTAPAPQAAALLAASPALAARAAAVRYAPCWTGMLCFEAPVDTPYDGLFCEDGALRWAAFNGSKPGRSGQTWVLHTRPEWAREHLEASPEAVAEALAAALAGILGALPPPRWGQAHRWLYSLAETPLAEPCLWDPVLGLGAAGDWCGAPRFEGAWLSGMALAQRLLGEPPGAP